MALNFILGYLRLPKRLLVHYSSLPNNHRKVNCCGLIITHHFNFHELLIGTTEVIIIIIVNMGKRNEKGSNALHAPICTVAQKGHVHYQFQHFQLPILSFLITNFQLGYFSLPI